MFSELKEKVVVITGASGYLGKATAVEFARHGSYLVLTGRDEEKLRQTALLCKDVGLTDNELLIIAADITDENGIERVVHKTIDRFHRVHVLVNNAGVFLMGSSLSLTAADIDRVFSANCKSVFMLTQKLIMYLIETHGCIVNVSSTASLRANAGAIGYCMSKACLDQMTKALALGASGYIGKAVAVGFAGQGSCLVLTGRNDEKLQQTASLCKDVGLNDDKVNSAGVMMLANSAVLKAADVDRIFNINCRSVFILTKKLVPYLIENKESWSYWVHDDKGMPRPDDKGSCFGPSTVEDGTFYSKSSTGLSKDQIQEYSSFLRSIIPLGRLCKADDVVKSVLFLTSNRAAFITGVLLPVDGGFRNQKLFLPKQFKDAK
ncbi:hypothetical protein LSH36_236g04032 [Paralvinella palmiformis]|uniref:Ketoreductase domain-containing protein n=1 Tax=Paralvinella palmiformis TaxID=53620 RepID=A0AAD9JM39_9ANNE|nr:hypothetical protein LSH36_236g04032 [Paralvinella palmiformis]